MVIWPRSEMIMIFSIRITATGIHLPAIGETSGTHAARRRAHHGRPVPAIANRCTGGCRPPRHSEPADDSAGRRTLTAHPTWTHQRDMCSTKAGAAAPATHVSLGCALARHPRSTKAGSVDHGNLNYVRFLSLGTAATRIAGRRHERCPVTYRFVAAGRPLHLNRVAAHLPQSGQYGAYPRRRSGGRKWLGS